MAVMPLYGKHFNHSFSSELRGHWLSFLVCIIGDVGLSCTDYDPILPTLVKCWKMASFFEKLILVYCHYHVFLLLWFLVSLDCITSTCFCVKYMKRTICMLDGFICFIVVYWFSFFKINFFKFKTFFQKCYQCVKQFRSRSGPTLCPGLS